MKFYVKVENAHPCLNAGGPYDTWDEADHRRAELAEWYDGVYIQTETGERVPSLNQITPAGMQFLSEHLLTMTTMRAGVEWPNEWDQMRLVDGRLEYTGSIPVQYLEIERTLWRNPDGTFQYRAMDQYGRCVWACPAPSPPLFNSK